MEHESSMSRISFLVDELILGVSYISSSVCTDKAEAILTNTGKLNFVFPVSIDLNVWWKFLLPLQAVPVIIRSFF